MPSIVPSRYAVSLLRLLPDDTEKATVLADANCSFAMLDSEETVSAEIYCDIFIGIVKRLQHYLHGEDADDLSRVSNYRLLLMSMVQATTLKEALNNFTAFFRRLGPEGSAAKLILSNNTAILRITYSDDLLKENVWSPEMFSMDRLNWLPGTRGISISLWIWHRLCCWLIGEYIPLQQARVNLSASDKQHAELNKMFNGTLLFDQDYCSIEFEKRFLKHEIVQNQQTTDTLLSKFPLELMLIEEQPKTLAEQIKSLIGSDLSRAMPDAETVAKRCNIAVATLHRRLQKENTSYQNIKDQCRYDAAITMLQGGNTAIKEIASQLNYSDVSTFHRAFKKWSGVSPAQYRDTCHSRSPLSH
ncbi:hypothetical protein SIN8267_00294 [Sinobacterium norvegicum]|uniref:HTH araC/xylS-type domain-containing protein n=1 Tax=Sinobacterium norvegicum TaxID=1641715 RepID=A0ABN8EH62_9GAMM|nr:AraC family transcriptional regulator [Sinobacterium norvegicum]CAH0990202.1 hypothetical protein SIN8267_00294 [Sinobacterium norvegicum]